MIVGPVPPPPVGNDTEAIMAYVNHQLDSIGKRTEILGGLRLLGGGRHERLQGGECLLSGFCSVSWRCVHSAQLNSCPPMPLKTRQTSISRPTV